MKIFVIALFFGFFNGFINAAKLEKLEKAANAMSLDLFKILMETQTGNFISSPFGVSQLLMILSTGSLNETKHQFEKALHIESADTFEHGSLDITSKWDKNILNMANKIYINDRYTIRKQFIDNTVDISNKTNAEEIFESMSFGNPTDSVKNMNQWVEKQTNNKIKNFLEADKIDMNTYLLLINALYFKGMWKHSFDKNKTFDKSFYVDNNTPKNVPTMQVTSEIFYKSHEGLGAEIVRLPYQAKDGCDPMSMIIILPNWEQSLSDIQKKLNTVTLESLYPTDKSKMHLYLPKFIIETKLSLNEHLKKMGIKDAFTSKANFHGITEQNGISISKVIQQAFIEVNEDGTKAAAATHMGIMPLSAYGGPLDIHVNRPFLFLLATERVILFTGYVNDPTTK